MESTINLWLMVPPLSITGTAQIFMKLNTYRFPKVFKTYELTFRVYLSIFPYVNNDTIELCHRREPLEAIGVIWWCPSKSTWLRYRINHRLKRFALSLWYHRINLWLVALIIVLNTMIIRFNPLNSIHLMRCHYAFSLPYNAYFHRPYKIYHIKHIIP